MSISLPSREIYVVDVPEPIQFSSEFLYNFFVPDEGSSETGGISDRYLRRSSSDLGSDFIEYATTRVPRFNILKWSLPKIVDNETSEQQQRKNNNVFNSNGGLISKNLQKIVTENDLSTYDYFSILLDDPFISDKVFSYVSSSILQHLDGDSNNDVSHYKSVSRLGKNLPSYIDLDFLKSGISQLDKSSGARFFDQKGSLINNDKLSELKSVNMSVQINSKLAQSMLARSIIDPHSPYTSEFQDLLETSSRLSAYMKQKAITGFDENHFREFVPYIDISAGSKNNQAGTSVKLVGFIIDKVEHLPDGSVKIHDSIIIENPKIYLTTDLRVKYGSTYSYTVRSIALFTMPAIDEETDEIANISFLVSSKPSSRSIITCVENISPPVPADINFTWNYETNKLMIHWMFPPNSQRDIKEFQIFRRNSINEPFELIKVYRFNDAKIQNDLTIHYQEDGINDSVVEEIESPITYYVDDEFQKNSSFIYTVCSIDAHGLTSNYGSQYQISFEQFQNKLQKKLISHSGAPKPYPNLYLNEDLFKDTIRVSGQNSKRMKIYFNPEFYELIDNQNRKTDVIATKQNGGSYKLQFINIERQKSVMFNIEINDQRTVSNVLKEKLILK